MYLSKAAVKAAFFMPNLDSILPYSDIPHIHLSSLLKDNSRV